MDHDAHLAALRLETGRFADVLASGDPDRPVPACPGWDLAELVAHLERVHRWAAAQVRAGLPDGPARKVPAGDRAGAPLEAWYRSAAAELVTALDDAGPSAPCWTFMEPAASRFWSRRQAHETLIHRWDAERSQGEPGPLDADLCADGIDEVVAMCFPRQVRLGRQAPLVEAVEVRSAGRSWVLGADVAPQATLSGPPDRLLLLLWGRLDRADPAVEVEGDGEVVARILEASLVP